MEGKKQRKTSNTPIKNLSVIHQLYTSLPVSFSFTCIPILINNLLCLSMPFAVDITSIGCSCQQHDDQRTKKGCCNYSSCESNIYVHNARCTHSSLIFLSSSHHHLKLLSLCLSLSVSLSLTLSRIKTHTYMYTSITLNSSWRLGRSCNYEWTKKEVECPWIKWYKSCMKHIGAHSKRTSLGILHSVLAHAFTNYLSYN